MFHDAQFYKQFNSTFIIRGTIFFFFFSILEGMNTQNIHNITQTVYQFVYIFKISSRWKLSDQYCPLLCKFFHTMHEHFDVLLFILWYLIFFQKKTKLTNKSHAHGISASCCVTNYNNKNIAIFIQNTVNWMSFVLIFLPNTILCTFLSLLFFFKEKTDRPFNLYLKLLLSV